MYPPGMRAGQAWYRMTATTAKARRAWISGRQRRARCAGASTVSDVDAGEAMVLSRIRPRGPAASRYAEAAIVETPRNTMATPAIWMRSRRSPSSFQPSSTVTTGYSDASTATTLSAPSRLASAKESWAA